MTDEKIDEVEEFADALIAAEGAPRALRLALVLIFKVEDELDDAGERALAQGVRKFVQQLPSFDELDEPKN